MQQAEPTNQSTVSLSVVLAASHEDPSLRTAVANHTAGLRAVGGELLVADGTQAGLDGIDTAVHLPGKDVFTLRAAAAARARGRVIVLTEDHVLPATYWHQSVLDAHERHAELAVGGAVLNGTRERLIDRANFLMTFCASLPPQPLRHPHRVAPPANVSYKREAFAERQLEMGTLEFDLASRVFSSGQMVLDDQVRVFHLQSHSVRSTHMAHFHNGRTTAAFTALPAGRRARVLAAARKVTQPLALVRTVCGETWNKPGYRRDLLTSLPFVVSLAIAHAVGEFMGLFFGAGDSPSHLE